MQYVYPYPDVDEQIKLAVWQKGRIIPGYNSNVWRQDMCGTVMKYGEYGLESKYGWEIDHIYPKDLGGSDDLSNLQPLHWRNNRRKGNTYPWFCI